MVRNGGLDQPEPCRLRRRRPLRKRQPFRLGVGESAGWISFSCKNNGDTCGDVDYGVRIDLSNGVFEGYAWSEVVGWINFNLASTSYSAYAAKTSWPHAISGNAGVGGFELSYNDGGGVKTATAEANGDYSFNVSYGWDGTVTPYKPGYTFDPP